MRSLPGQDSRAPAANASDSRYLGVRPSRDRIISAVAELAAADGYQAVTLDQIAKKARVSHTTLQGLFEGKEEAFLAALTDAAERAAAAVAKAAGNEQQPWPERISAGLLAILEAAQADLDLARSFLIESRTAGPEALALYEDALARLVPPLYEGRHSAATGPPGFPTGWRTASSAESPGISRNGSPPARRTSSPSRRICSRSCWRHISASSRHASWPSARLAARRRPERGFRGRRRRRARGRRHLRPIAAGPPRALPRARRPQPARAPHGRAGRRRRRQGLSGDHRPGHHQDRPGLAPRLLRAVRVQERLLRVHPADRDRRALARRRGGRRGRSAIGRTRRARRSSLASAFSPRSPRSRS